MTELLHLSPSDWVHPRSLQKVVHPDLISPFRDDAPLMYCEHNQETMMLFFPLELANKDYMRRNLELVAMGIQLDVYSIV